MATLDSVAKRLDALDDDFSIFSGNPPTKSAIVALEKKLGVKLLPEHRALIAKLASCAIIADEKAWPRPVAFEVRPAWQFCWGIEVFGIAPKTAGALDVVVQSTIRAPAGKQRLVAAMSRLGERTCVGYDAKGKLYEWEPKGRASALKAKGLLAILDSWLETLAEDKDKMKKAPSKKKTAAKAAGKTAEQWLEQLLDDDDADATANKLMKEAPAVRAAVIALVTKALKKNPDATEHLWALAWIDKDEAVLDALIAYAQKGKDDVRTTALGILGANEKKPKRVVPVLLAALADKDEEVVQEAAAALENYADPTMIAPLTLALVKAQKSPRWVYDVTVGNIMAVLAKAAAKGRAKDRDAVVDVLTANLAPKASRYAAQPAFDGLIELGPKAKRAVPALEKAAAGKDLYLSSYARYALCAITGNASPHLAALKVAAKNKDSAVKAVAQDAVRFATRGR